MVLAQLRHVRAAEWSDKAAIKNQQDMLLAVKLGEAEHIPLKILQGEVGCECI
jgi:hypothetical protein